MAADDTVQSLATRAAVAFTAYRGGDIRAMDELVDLLRVATRAADRGGVVSHGQRSTERDSPAPVARARRAGAP